MSIEYAWTFPSLEVSASVDGFQDVVSVVHWRYGASDGDHYSDLYGATALPPPCQPFVSFADITQDVIKGWVIAELGPEKIDAMTSALAETIEKKKNPNSSLLVPWG